MTRPFARTVGVALAVGLLAVLYVFLEAPVYSVGTQGLPVYKVDAQRLYLRHCSTCHGDAGRGNGPVGSLLDPRPRDFGLRQGFRLVSTQGRYPSKEDILRVLRRGMPGTAMPAWDHLPQREREALADYVLHLSREGLRKDLLAELAKDLDFDEAEKEAEAIVNRLTDPGEPIVIPPEPSRSEDHLAQGKKFFIEICAKCHEEDGSGRDDPSWRTAEGFPIVSGNLKRGLFKGGPEGEDLFRRVCAGLPGTPMPGGSDSLSGSDMWSVVHYVLSLSDEEQRRTANRVWTPPRAAMPAEGDANIGKQLITGAARFANGAPPCSGCHSISGIRDPGGGVWGPDLTEAYRKFGDVMSYWPENVAPMKPIYTANPLTDEEKAHLVASFKEGWDDVKERRDSHQPPPVLTAATELSLFTITGLLVAIGFSVVGTRAGTKTMEVWA